MKLSLFLIAPRAALWITQPPTQRITVLSEGVQCRGVGLNIELPPDAYMAQYLTQHRCSLTWPVKMNYSGWTKDVEDVSLHSKLGITGVNECSKCFTNKNT